MDLKRRTLLVAGLYATLFACDTAEEPGRERGEGGGKRRRRDGEAGRDEDEASPGDGNGAKPDTPPGQEAKGILRLTDKVDGIDREATLFVPSSYDGSSATPLLLGTHGNGGTGATVYSKFGWRDRCEQEGWLGIFPNSDIPGRTDSGDNTYFDHLMKRITGEYNVDRKRIWGTGFSGGCHRQYIFAVKHDWLKAIGVSGGAISHGNDPERENPLTNNARPISVLHIHGGRDTSIPLGGGMLNGKDGVQRPLLSVRDGMEPWIQNIKGEKADTETLPAGCPTDRDLQTHRWEGIDGHVVQIVVDPKLKHEWASHYATDTIARWLKQLNIS